MPPVALDRAAISPAQQGACRVIDERLDHAFHEILVRSDPDGFGGYRHADLDGAAVGADVSGQPPRYLTSLARFGGK